MPPTSSLDVPAVIAGFAVLLSWLGFGAILIVCRRAAAQTEKKRDVKSHLGFALQSCAYGLCFAFSRPYFSPLVRSSHGADIAMMAVIVILALGSDWFCLDAARTLGKQWALVARVVEGHELVQNGPYALVRNPILYGDVRELNRHRASFQPLDRFHPGHRSIPHRYRDSRPQ